MEYERLQVSQTPCGYYENDPKKWGVYTLTGETFKRRDGSVGYEEGECLCMFEVQSEAIAYAKERAGEVIVSNENP